jgi:4-oxalocrotonate tautomerase
MRTVKPDRSAGENQKGKGETNMPIISWEGGKLTKEQKKDLIQRLTEVAVEVTKVPVKFYSVVIREQQDENLGFAGETVEEIKGKIAKG